MGPFIDALVGQQLWLFIFGTLLVVGYRALGDAWHGRLVVALLIVVLASMLFVSADVVEFVAERGGENVKIAVGAAKFASSVVWGAVGVGLVIHAATYENNR